MLKGEALALGVARRPILGLRKSHLRLMDIVASQAVPLVEAPVQRALEDLLGGVHRRRGHAVLAEGLPYPHLAHPLGAHWGHPRMQRIRV